MWFQRGKKDGREFARHANCEILAYASRMETFQEFARRSNGHISDYDPTKDAVLGRYFSKMAAKYKLIGSANENAASLAINPFFQQWEYGWFEGVCDYLRNVCERKPSSIG